MSSDNPYQSPPTKTVQTDRRQARSAGLMVDLGIAIATYLVLATAIGIYARPLAVDIAPSVGETAARFWWVPLALGYSVWQFVSRQRKRRLRDYPEQGP